MLQPGGTMLIVFPIHHVIFDVLKNIAHNFRFAPYLQVIYTFYICLQFFSENINHYFCTESK